MYHVPVAVGKGKELIDTLWNVNVSTVIYGGYPVKKINRYIIE